MDLEPGYRITIPIILQSSLRPPSLLTLDDYASSPPPDGAP